jgi:hypothetical protein
MLYYSDILPLGRRSPVQDLEGVVMIWILQRGPDRVFEEVRWINGSLESCETFVAFAVHATDLVGLGRLRKLVKHEKSNNTMR